MKRRKMGRKTDQKRRDNEKQNTQNKIFIPSMFR